MVLPTMDPQLASVLFPPCSVHASEERASRQEKKTSKSAQKKEGGC
jgi:hypothetical protein